MSMGRVDHPKVTLSPNVDTTNEDNITDDLPAKQ